MQNSISKTTIRISGPKFLTDMQYKALGYRTNGYKSVQEVEWEQDSNSVIGKSPQNKMGQICNVFQTCLLSD